MKLFAIGAVAAAAAFAVTPASAKMMACSGANMATSMTGISMMYEGPVKYGMNREMGNANMAMSKGNMRGACKSYMKAQRMAMK